MRVTPSSAVLTSGTASWVRKRHLFCFHCFSVQHRGSRAKIDTLGRGCGWVGRALASHTKTLASSLALHNWLRWPTSVIPTIQRQRQDDQTFAIVFGYREHWQAWTGWGSTHTGDCAWQMKGQERRIFHVHFQHLIGQPPDEACTQTLF